MNTKLDVRAHRQDNSTSCGRACAQVVIGSEFKRLGVAGGTALPEQSVMAAAEAGALTNWFTEPLELATHINNGLQALPNAKRWEVVEFKPAGSTDPILEAASGLFDVVSDKKDAGFPSVVLIDANDHWETAIGYEIFSDHTELYTLDPLPPLASPLGTPHFDNDACFNNLNFNNGNTVWFTSSDIDTVGALVCDALPFVGSAIGIVQTDPSDWWSSGGGSGGGGFSGQPPLGVNPAILEAWRDRHVANEFNVRDPLPPLDPLIVLIHFFRSDWCRIIGAMERLQEGASFSDFDWSRVVVRHGSFLKHPERRMAIVAAPPREGKEGSILLSIGRRGAVEAMHLTSSERVVETLRSAGDEPLWIVPRYSRWLPFVRIGQDQPARYRRLYDGFEIRIPAEGHGQR